MAKKVEWVYFQGKGSYFNSLTKGDHEYKNWSVKLHFNKASLELFMKLKEKEGEVEGIMNEVKMDDDGEFHFFKRPFFKNFGHGDEPLLPPEILDDNGQPWNRAIEIGNGSDITVKCETYQYTKRHTKNKGRAIRLVAVMVNNLVPVTIDNLDPERALMAKGLDGQPKQLF